MPIVTTNSIQLYYEEVGHGVPILFIHELAGDYRSWEPQMRHFARDHRCIVYSARGYHPSSIPESPDAYSQAQAAADAIGLLDELGIEQAHIVGLSMGSFATLQLGLDYPERALSLSIAGCGSGSDPETYKDNARRYQAMAERISTHGYQDFVDTYSTGPYRQAFMRKDPRGWQEFAQRLAEHSPLGKANTLQGVQGSRPSIYSLQARLNALRVPSLILCGDQDTPCLLPSLYLAAQIPDARLAIFPDTGHTLNLEEPEAFNRHMENFYRSLSAK